MMRQLAKWFAEKERLDAVAAGDPVPSDKELLERSTLKVLTLHPDQVLRLLEEVWAYADDPLSSPADKPGLALPPALRYGLVPGQESGLRDLLVGVTATPYDPIAIARPTTVDSGRGAGWDHLVYAYMIENTRVIEVFAKVLFEYLHGERLEVPSDGTHRWLRTTEALFFRALPTTSVGAVVSDVRPDAAATRRNAYLRLFGMDLNHGRGDTQSYPFHRPTAVNNGFVPLFEDFLREVWIASENARNSSGSNPTDDAAIATFAKDLWDMLRTRRRDGNLAREEYFFTTMMSWFHLTLESDTTVVRDLKAQAGSPEERLRKIGERVGLPPHARSESFFVLAGRLSSLLRAVENGDYNESGKVGVLYADPQPPLPPNPLRKDMLEIINHWSIATGRDMKARRTTTTPRAVNVTINGGGPVRANGRAPVGQGRPVSPG